MTRFLEWILNLDPGTLTAGHWRLGFISEYNNYVRLALLAVLVLMIWLTVHCYRREGQAAGRIKKLLAGLRIAVIVLVVTVLFQPAVILRVTETLYSSVLVLVDDSMSMDYPDRYAGEDQAAVRSGLAEDLGMPAGELETLSRRQIAVRQLTGEHGMLAELARDHPIEFLRFSTNQPAYTEPLGTLGVRPDAVPADQIAINAEASSILAGLRTDGYETDPAAALRDALDRFQGRRLGGVVVLSDGQPTAPNIDSRLTAALDYAEQRGVPRYAVLLGDPTPPRNVTVSAVRAPREVRKNNSASLQVLVTNRNLAGREGKLSVYRRAVDEEWPADMSTLPPVTSQTVTLTAQPEGEKDQQTASQQVEVDIRPVDLGEYVYRAEIATLDEERTGEDNAAEAYVTVTDEKIRVLLISADAGWEFQYLRNYFLRQPDLYRTSVWQQNADSEINQAASTGMKLTRLPRELKELIDSGRASEDGEDVPPGYHVVILYDPTPTEGGFDKDFLDLLYEFVSVHRGGLCYIASTRNTYEVLRDPVAEKLATLLPVEVDQNRVDVSDILRESKPQAWRVGLSSYGVDHPVTRLDSSSELNERVWSNLPGIYWSQAVARAKPAARVLAENTNPSRKMTLRNEPEPLLATQMVGNGRVLYVGFDETWRWRFLGEGRYQRRFWGNVVRYLAPGNARQVVITAGGDRFDAGSPIRVDVEAFDRDYKPLRRDSFPLRVVNTRTRETETFDLAPIEGKPGRYQATIQPGHTGVYELTCPPDLADPVRVAGKQIVVELPAAESRRTEADRRTMRTIASKPEYFLTADQIERLAELIPPGRLDAVEYERYTLWDTKLTWILIAGLLAMEWFLRKRKNMA